MAVIGAGPAGCATALACQQAFQAANEVVSIHVFDAASANTNQKIAIGETLPPAAMTVLQQLSLRQLLKHERHIVCHGSCSVWGSEAPQYNDFMQEALGVGYHLDRNFFNQQLKQAVQQAGLTLHTQYRLASVESDHQAHQLSFKTPQGDETWNADFVVDASGISGSFARRFGVARNVLDQVISISAIVACTQQTKLSSFTLIEAAEYGWWYTARLPNNQMISSLCTDASEVKERQLNQQANWVNALLNTQFIVKHLDPKSLALIDNLHQSFAPSAILSKVIGENWLAVGDAASSYDSISSAGITKALQQGILAGKSIAEYYLNNDSDALNRYENAVFYAFNQYIELRDTLYRSEIRYQDSPFWQRRLFLNDAQGSSD